MPKLKITTAKKLIRFLERNDFVQARKSGSHVILGKSGNLPIVVPFHQGKDLGRGLIASILKSAKISEEFYQKNIQA